MTIWDFKFVLYTNFLRDWKTINNRSQQILQNSLHKLQTWEPRPILEGKTPPQYQMEQFYDLMATTFDSWLIPLDINDYSVLLAHGTGDLGDTVGAGRVFDSRHDRLRAEPGGFVENPPVVRGYH